MPRPSSKDPRSIRRMFDQIAHRYDFLNRLLSLSLDRRWRQNLVDELKDPPVLDLACGSGDVLWQMDQSEDLHGSIGVDFSSEMLGVAREKIGGSSSTGLVQGDVLELPFAGNTFRSTTCGFGVRNFGDRPRAFREVRRILAPDGIFAVLEFFPPRNSFWRKPVHWYLEHVLPVVGNLWSGSVEAYDYLSRSIEAFVPVDSLIEELRAAGFDGIEVRYEFVGLVKIITSRNGT